MIVVVVVTTTTTTGLNRSSEGSKKGTGKRERIRRDFVIEIVVTSSSSFSCWIE